MLVWRSVTGTEGSAALAAYWTGITAGRGTVYGRQLPYSSDTPGRPVAARTTHIGGPVLIAGHLPPLPHGTIIHRYSVAAAHGISHHCTHTEHSLYLGTHSSLTSQPQLLADQ